MRIKTKIFKIYVKFKKKLQKYAEIISENLNDFIQFINTSPILSKGPIKIGLLISISFFMIFILWGLLAPISSAAIAPGTIVLSTKTKIIQHLEGGIIKEILVKEGDFVERGETLIVLDPTSSNANLELLYNQLRSELAIETRLLAEQNCRMQIEFKDQLLNDKNNEELLKIITTQKNLFNSRMESYRNRIAILEQKIEQFKEQIKGLESQKNSAEEQLILLEKEEKVVNLMVHNGQETNSRLLTLQRQISEIKGSIGSFISKISEIKQAISATELEILDFKVETQKEVSKELGEIEVKINDIKARVIAAEDVSDRQIIKAEYSGVITNLRFNAVGGTIPPHTEIMTIVPQNEELIIEARLNPQDIDVVHKGLKARVRLTAFKTRYIPTLKGEVIHVSADQIVDQAMRTAYYIVRVRVDNLDSKNKYVFKNKELQLYPGMPAEVLIVTGKRTFFGYLMSPIMKTFRRSFKEE